MTRATVPAARTVDALAALCGILAVVLSFGGFMLIGSAGFAVPPGASSDVIAKVAAREAPPLAFLGLSLDILGSLAFLLFAARLWGTLRRAEADPGWLSTAAFGAALLAVAASFVDKTLYHAVFTQAGHGLEAGTAAVLYAAIAASFTLFNAFVGLYLGLAAVIVLRTGVLPRWLGWLGIVVLVVAVVGVLLPASGLGFVAFPLVLVWLASASLLLLRRPLVA